MVFIIFANVLEIWMLILQMLYLYN